MNKAERLIKYVVLIIASVVSVFPLYWMAVSATNKSTDILAGKMLPGKHIIENFTNLSGSYNIGGAMVNSMKYSVLMTVASLIICSLAGYGFEIYHDKVKDKVMSILLLALMVPFVAILIPLFQMMSKLGLLNTALGFMLPSLSTPFLIMLFRQNAKAFPYEIVEAARIDGCTELRIFVSFFIPTMKSTFAAAIIITFMNAWNSYLWPKVIMQTDESITMPILIASLKDGYFTDYGVLMLAVLICTLPTIIIFFFLQKQFAEGIAGSVK